MQSTNTILGMGSYINRLAMSARSVLINSTNILDQITYRDTFVFTTWKENATILYLEKSSPSDQKEEIEGAGAGWADEEL